MPLVTVGDLPMYYEVHGEGSPLVVIPGLANDVSQYTELLPGLSARHRVLIFDNRGAGRTAKPREPYSIEQMAEDTAGLMETTGFERAAVLGVSMGGRVALALALNHPEMVDGLVLVSTSARVNQRSPVRRLLMAAIARLPFLRGEHPQPSFAFKNQVAASGAYDCTARLGEIRVPTVILRGRTDHLATAELTRELHEGIAGSELREFPGGHVFFLLRDRKGFLDAVDEIVR